jgi:hypothetical protein
MRIRLDLLRFERGHRTVPDVVVQLGNRLPADAFVLVPRSPLPERRFTGPADKQGIEQRLGLLVEQQIAVEFQVARQHVVPEQRQRGRRLRDVVKRRVVRVQQQQGLLQRVPRRPPGRFVGDLLRSELKDAVKALEEARIVCPRRKVQVAEHLLENLLLLTAQLLHDHPDRSASRHGS